MDVELNAEAKDKRLNNLVALTVVVFSVATGLAPSSAIYPNVTRRCQKEI